MPQPQGPRDVRCQIGPWWMSSSGACSGIKQPEMLKTPGNRSSGRDNHLVVGVHDMVEIINRLRHCPRLEYISFNHTGMGQEAGQALLQILHERCWPSLNDIDISGNPHLGNDLVGVELASVLEEGSLPQLERLNVGNTGLGREGAERLLGGLIEKASVCCPKLEEVTVAQCGIDEEWKERMMSCGIDLWIQLWC